MPTRRLTANGPLISAIGLGCMGMSFGYGPRDDDESLATIDKALDSGITFFDTADIYGYGRNEELLGRALSGRRDHAVIATKFGFVPGEGQPYGALNGRPDYVHRACDASLKRLRTDVIDLYYLHRVDPEVPVEETVGAMAELVTQGKVRHLGLSEISTRTLRRAHAIHPITALQSEYSLWTREVEAQIIPACRDLGVGFVPFSPLGRGFLTGRVKTGEFDKRDIRSRLPRFQGDNFRQNMQLIGKLEEIAAAKSCTPAQVALAWLLAQGNDIVPIPGTKKRRYMEENVGAVAVQLTAEELAALGSAFSPGIAAGERYDEHGLATLDR